MFSIVSQLKGFILTFPAMLSLLVYRCSAIKEKIQNLFYFKLCSFLTTDPCSFLHILKFDNSTPIKFCGLNPSCLSRTALISSLLEDEKYQRDAFAAQLIKQDSRHKQICSQVEQIQNELASLTMVEMTKRDLQVKTQPSSSRHVFLRNLSS